MAKKVDSKVVEMRFENGQFEKSIQTSINSLDKLKASLNFKDTTKSFNEFEQGMGSNGQLAKSIDALTSKFSTMGIVGMTVVNRLTNAAIDAAKQISSFATSGVVSGGWSRAANIENAKFQLEGLGVAWNRVKDSIDYGVKDTAYGLDSAAKAAAQLVATQVNVGEEMSTALRAISGVAAMTNSTYDEIANVFVSIAGIRKVTKGELNRLSIRGINAQAELAKYLGKSMSEIDDMISKGKISFKEFAAAMDESFGEHAKDANRTFDGALSNVRAALARTGEGFAEAIREAGKDSLNAIRPMINALNNEIKPIVDDFTGVVEHLSLKVQYIAGKIADSKILANVISTIRNGFYDILMLIMPIVDGFNMIFPPKTTYQMMKSFESLTETIANFVSKAYISREAAANLRDTFSGFFSVIDIVLKFFKALIEVFTPLPIDLLSIGDGFLSVTGVLGRFVRAIDEYLTRNNTFVETFTTIKNAIQPLVDVFAYVFNVIIDGLMTFGRSLKEFDFGKSARDMSLLEGVMGALSAIGETFFKAFRVVGDVFELIWPRIKDAAIIIKGSLDQIFDAFHDALTGNGFEGMMMLIDSMAAAGVSLSAFDLFDVIKSRIKNLPNMLANVNSIVFQLKQTLVIFQEAVKADVLMTTAKAVGIMALSLIGLSLVPMKDLASRLLILGSVVGILVAAMKILLQPLQEIRTIVYGTGWKGTLGSFVAELGKLATRFLEMGAITFVIKEFAIAVGILSASLFALSMTDPTRLFVSLIAVITLMGTLTLMAEHLSKLDNPKLMMGKLVLVAVAVAILGKSIRAFEGAKWGDILKGLAAYAGIFTILGVFMKQVAKLNSTGVELIIQSVASSMIKFAIAIGIISLAFKAFQGMNIQEIINAVIAIGDAMVLMAGFTLFMKTFEISDDFSRLAPTFLLFSASLVVLAGAFKAFQGIDIQSIINAVIAIGDAMVLMAGFTLFAKTFEIMKDLLPAAGAILVFATAMTVLGVAFHIFAAIPVEKLGYALVTFALVLAGMVVTFHALKGVLPEMLGLAGTILAIGAATLMAGGGILLMATALGMVAMLPISQNAEQLIAFAGALGLILGVTIAFAVVSKVAWQTLLALGGAFALIGVGVLAAGAGIAILTMGVQGLVAMAAAGGQTMAVLNTIFKGFVQTAVITTALMTALIFVITKMGIAATPAIPGLLAIGGAIALIGVGILAAGAGVNLFAKSLALIGRYAQEGAVGMAVLTPFIAQFGAALLVVGAAVGLVAIDLFSLAAAGIACIPASVGILAMGLALLALDAGVALAAEALDKLIESIKKVKEVFEGSEDIGSMFVQGLINGILNGIPNAIKAGLSLAQSVMNAVTGKNGFDEHSPSIPGWLAGVFYGKGTAGGLLSTLGINAAAGTEIAQVTMDNYESGMDDVADVSEEKGEEMAEGTVSGYQRFMGQGRTKKIVYDEGFKLADTTAEGTKDGWEANTSSFEDIMEQFGLSGESKLDASNARILDSADEAAERYKLTWFNAMWEVEGNFSADWGSALSQARTNDQYNAIKKAAEAEGYFTWLEQQNTKATNDNTDATDKNTGSKAKAAKEDAELEKALKNFGKTVDLTTKKYKDFYEGLNITESFKKFAENILKSEDNVKAFGKTYDNISSAISKSFDNLFDEPKDYGWMDKSELLQNMQDNFEDVQKWGQMMTGLSGKITDGLYQKLAEMGPESYKYVHAFSEMTSEELERANSLWMDKANLTENLTNEVAAGWVNTGFMASQGLIKGMESAENEIFNTGAEMGDASVEGLTSEEGLDTHSPSKRTYEAGQYAGEGLVEGIKSYIQYVAAASTVMGNQVVDSIRNAVLGGGARLGASGGTLESIGQQIVTKIAAGMVANVASLDAIIESTIGRITTVINNKASEINQNGRYICQHLVTGFRDEMDNRTRDIDSAIETLYNMIVDSFESESNNQIIKNDIVGWLIDKVCEELNSEKTTYKKLNKAYNQIVKHVLEHALKREENKEDFKSVGQFWIEGIIEGIDEKIEELSAKLEEVGKLMAEVSKESIDAHSPSKVAEEIGGYWSKGLANGVMKHANKVLAAASAITDAVIEDTSSIKANFDNFAKTFDKQMTKINNKAIKAGDTYLKKMPKGLKSFLNSISSQMKPVKNFVKGLTQDFYEQTTRLNKHSVATNKARIGLINFGAAIVQDTQVFKDYEEQVKKAAEAREKMEEAIAAAAESGKKEAYEEAVARDKGRKTIAETKKAYEEEQAQIAALTAQYEEAKEAIPSVLETISKALKEYKNTLRDSIKETFTFFSAFDYGEKISPSTILGNAQSHYNAWAKYGEALGSVAVKGLDSGLWLELQKGGLGSLDQLLSIDDIDNPRLIAVINRYYQNAKKQANKAAKKAVESGGYAFGPDAEQTRKEIEASLNAGDEAFIASMQGRKDAMTEFFTSYKEGSEEFAHWNENMASATKVLDAPMKLVNSWIDDYNSKVGEEMRISTTEGYRGLLKFGEALGVVAEDCENSADYISKVVDAVSEFRTSMKDAFTISNPFQKFEKDTELSLDQIKYNMNSQLTAVQDFYKNLEKMREIGFSDEMIQYVASMGYESGSAYAEQFAKASKNDAGGLSDIYKKMTTIPDQYADAMTANLIKMQTSIGENLQESANNAFQQLGMKIPKIDPEEVKKAQEEAASAGTSVGSSYSSAVSESAGTYEQGYMLIEGTADGVDDASPTLVASFVRAASSSIDGMADTFSSSSTSQKISSALSGAASTSIEYFTYRASESIINSTTALASEIASASSSSFDKMVTKFNEAVNKIKQLIDSIPKDIGITITANTSQADAAIDELNAKIASLRSEMDSVGVSMGQSTLTSSGRAYQEKISNFSGNQNGSGNGVTINYTQNNNSPKSLSAVEIYRQTQSSLNQMKNIATNYR